MWFSSRRTRGNTRVRSFHRTLPLWLEVLENRTLLSTYLVTNTYDNSGGNPAPGAGTGTLRQAIVDANANPGADVIQFNPGVTGTITLTSGELDITDAVDLQGPGASVVTVSGNNASLVFRVSVSATISGLTITGGISSNGGGIYNTGSLTVRNCTFDSNTGFNSPIVGTAGLTNTLVGSGIYNTQGGATTVSGSTFSNNTGSGIFNDDANSTVNVSGSTFFRNQAGAGGGIFLLAGMAQVNNSTFSNNTASGLQFSAGGGICLFKGGTLEVSNSTFANNQGGFAGGGLSVSEGATANVSNCTFSGNSASYAGGIFQIRATLTVTNSTLSGNTATTNAGGGIWSSGTSPIIGNTIIAGNTAVSGPDGNGVFTSEGNNLVGKTDSSSGWVGSDLTGTIAMPLNPLLAPLGNNGGPTQTMALLPGSPAIDAGSDALAAGVTADQRGLPYTRIFGNHVDIGAFESRDPVVVRGTAGADSITVAQGSRPGTLKTIVNGVVTDSIYRIDRIEGLGGDDTITITASLAGVVMVVDGGDGSDTYSVSFGNLAGTVTIADTGLSTDNDTLSVYGLTDPNTPNTFNKTSGTITWAPSSSGPPVETVTYSGISAVNIYGGHGPDYITDPGTQTTIYGGPQQNTITITATTGSGVVINGGPSSSTNHYVIDMGSLLGPVTINSTTGTSTVTVNGPPGSNVLTLTAAQLTGDGETINLNLGTTATNFTVAGGFGNNNQLVIQGTPPGPVTAQNLAPTVGTITAPLAPNAVNTAITASAGFTNLDGNSQTAAWNWGDNTTSMGTVSQTATTGTVTGGHSYTIDGVFTITLTVTDSKGGGSSTSLFQYVVIYNPSGGFVTGGGWIPSPLGAFVANPALTGKASFGIDVKYQSGSILPTGSTDFEFPAANFSFQSTSYAWLTLSGTMAQYQGTGTLNGASGYGFIVTVTDGDLLGGAAPDTFRIRIWDVTQGNGTTSAGLIYDNDASVPVYNNPSGTVLGGGSITIHTGGGGGAAAPPGSKGAPPSMEPATPLLLDRLFATEVPSKPLLATSSGQQVGATMLRIVLLPLPVREAEALFATRQPLVHSGLLHMAHLVPRSGGCVTNLLNEGLVDQLAQNRLD